MSQLPRDERAVPEPKSARPERSERLWRELVGEQLRGIRRSRSETLQSVARRAGVSPQYVSEIERGIKEPRVRPSPPPPGDPSAHGTFTRHGALRKPRQLPLRFTRRERIPSWIECPKREPSPAHFSPETSENWKRPKNCQRDSALPCCSRCSSIAQRGKLCDRSDQTSSGAGHRTGRASRRIRCSQHHAGGPGDRCPH